MPLLGWKTGPTGSAPPMLPPATPERDPRCRLCSPTPGFPPRLRYSSPCIDVWRMRFDDGLRKPSGIRDERARGRTGRRVVGADGRDAVAGPAHVRCERIGLGEGHPGLVREIQEIARTVVASEGRSVLPARERRRTGVSPNRPASSGARRVPSGRASARGIAHKR